MKKVLPYIILVILVFVSGNPVVSNRFVYPVLGVAGAVYLGFKFRERDTKILAGYIGCFIILFFSQWLVLGQISVLGSFNHIFKLIFGVAVFTYIGETFREKLLDVMAVISGISLVFYAFQICGLKVPDLFPSLSPNLNSVLVHNVNIVRDEYLRNCGPFWEPGAYAGFLFLSLALFIDDLKALVRRHPWHVLLILLAIATTRSTGGYICIVLLLLFFLVVELYRPRWWYFTAVGVAAFSVFLAFDRLPFLGDKIKYQVDVTLAQMKYEERPDYLESRTGAFVVDMYYVRQHPLAGNGFPVETRFANHPDEWDRIKRGHSNGFSNQFAQLGIPLALLYYVLLYFRLHFKEFRKWVFLALYILLMQEEMFLNFPLFIAFPFIILPSICSPSQQQ